MTGASTKTNLYKFVPPGRSFSNTKNPSAAILLTAKEAVFRATRLLVASFAMDIQNVLWFWSFTLSAIARWIANSAPV